MEDGRNAFKMLTGTPTDISVHVNEVNTRNCESHTQKLRIANMQKHEVATSSSFLFPIQLR